MWDICEVCGAVIADKQLHADWHADLGVVPSQPEPTTTMEVLTDGH